MFYIRFVTIAIPQRMLRVDKLQNRLIEVN